MLGGLTNTEICVHTVNGLEDIDFQPKVSALCYIETTSATSETQGKESLLIG